MFFCFFSWDKKKDQKNKIDFNVRFSLVTTSPWIQCASHLEMMNQARVFSVRVDPRGLAPGPHFAQVCYYFNIATVIWSSW
jgi:tripeptidyl-peptidase-2